MGPAHPLYLTGLSIPPDTHPTGALSHIIPHYPTESRSGSRESLIPRPIKAPEGSILGRLAEFQGVKAAPLVMNGT